MISVMTVSPLGYSKRQGPYVFALSSDLALGMMGLSKLSDGRQNLFH
jgi:hypothetical protein